MDNRRHCFQNVSDFIIFADISVFVGLKTFFFQAFNGLFPDFIPVIRMNIFEGIFADKFFFRVAGEFLV